jgi:hypothetical protein
VSTCDACPSSAVRAAAAAARLLPSFWDAVAAMGLLG